MATERIRARIIAVVFSIGFIVASTVFLLVSRRVNGPADSPSFHRSKPARDHRGIHLYCWISYLHISRKSKVGQTTSLSLCPGQHCGGSVICHRPLWIVGHFSSVEFAVSAPPILITWDSSCCRSCG